jgi:Gram-negative bacterial TonB protein C-terminal
MKLNEHEQAKPNVAGLTSQVQRAEMKSILAGTWPALKPLPVFKYGTDEYRAEIYFDGTRGEWVCRKTSLPSNKVQELRGGLVEMTMTLPHGQAEVFTGDIAAAEQQEQELENEANRRLQAIHEWKENYGNGALYSGLQNYLSGSQQDEIYDSIRMSLTARQLQFNPKNVAFVFDALWNAGGRLTTLIEIARRNRAEQEGGAQAQVEAAALETERQIPVETIHPTPDRRLQMRTTPTSPAHVMFGDTNGRIVLNPSVRDEEAAARYSEMFPSESTYAKHAISVDEIKPQQRPLPIPAATPTDVGVSMCGSGAEISTGDVPQSLKASFPSEAAKNIAPEPIKTVIPKLSESLTPEPVQSLTAATLENFPTEPMGSVSPDRVQTSLPEMIARTARQASEIAACEILDASPLSRAEDLQEKVHRRTPAAGFGTQVRTDRVEWSADRIEDSSSHFNVLEISGFRVAAFVLLFVVIGFTVGLTMGRGPLGKSPRDAQKSILAVNATSPAPPNRPGEMTSPISTPPAANTSNTPAVNPPALGTKELRAESPSAQALNARPADSGSRVRPIGPSPAVTSRSLMDSDNSSDANIGAPRNPDSRGVTPATRTAPHASPPSAILVSAPTKGSKPFRLTFPEKPIAASSSFAMTSQLSVLVSPEPGPAVAHQPARLQAGQLVSYVWPRYARPGNRYGSTETVKVRATIGPLGQVLDIKLVNGSTSLLPATMSAIRRWRYTPTLLNGRPVQAQQDITIEFRPPRYLSHVSTHH